MNTNGRKLKILSFYPYIVTILVLLLCLMVYPMQLFGRSTYINTSLEKGLFNNAELSQGYPVRSSFTPSYRNLDSLSFLFSTSGQAGEGYILLEIFDNSGQLIHSSDLKSADIMNNRWMEFPVSLELETDQIYQYQISAHDFGETSLTLYLGTSLIGPEESAECFYNGSSLDNTTPAVSFTYSGHVDSQKALPYYFLFLVLGIMLCTVCQKFEKTNEEDFYETER